MIRVVLFASMLEYISIGEAQVILMNWVQMRACRSFENVVKGVQVEEV